MNRIRLLLAALGLTALALVGPPAMAHGGHAHASQPVASVVDEPDGPNPARLEAQALAMPAFAVPSLAVPSPCPADEGGTCCCHGDRCTKPSQPRMCAMPAPGARLQPALAPERPRAAAHPIAVASAHTVGAVSARGPPVNSSR
ncbi:MAG TPA: hypothetical protein VJV77_01215 [Casimicrobiaceae bacterium]|nr:hypothetical protein [Casimicrobiaceae bacterium]